MKNLCLNFIIFYDNYLEVERYIENLNNVANSKVDLCIVVNKDSEKRANELLKKEYKNIPSIEMKDYGENIGYLNAMIQSMPENVSDYQYYILSNTDIEYVTTNFFDKLDANVYDNEIGCIAPSVYSFLTQSYSNPHYLSRISKKQMQRNIFIFKYPIIAKLYFWLAGKKAHAKASSEKESCEVYSPHGCFMIFVNDFAMFITSQSYGVKMYSEESYVGEMLIKAGKKCYYDSSIKVNHIESAVTSSLGMKNKSKMFAESLQYIYDLFYR